MVAGMVMRVRSLPIMSLSTDHTLKPRPRGLAAGRRERRRWTCRRQRKQHRAWQERAGIFNKVLETEGGPAGVHHAASMYLHKCPLACELAPTT